MECSGLWFGYFGGRSRGFKGEAQPEQLSCFVLVANAQESYLRPSSPFEGFTAV